MAAAKADSSRNPAQSDPRVSKAELLAELVRLKAENERLTRLVASQRPELEQIRSIEVGLRDLLTSLQYKAGNIEKLHAECAALLPSGNDDLPSLMELRGILSPGKNRVDAAIEKAEATR